MFRLFKKKCSCGVEVRVTASIENEIGVWYNCEVCKTTGLMGEEHEVFNMGEYTKYLLDEIDERAKELDEMLLECNDV